MEERKNRYGGTDLDGRVGMPAVDRHGAVNRVRHQRLDFEAKREGGGAGRGGLNLLAGHFSLRVGCRRHAPIYCTPYASFVIRFGWRKSLKLRQLTSEALSCYHAQSAVV